MYRLATMNAIVNAIKKYYEKAYRQYRMLINAINKSSTLTAFQIFGVVFGALISVQVVTAAVANTYESTIGWKQAEQAKIDKLSPLETLDYFSDTLGKPLMKEQVNESELTKHYYKGKDYWVIAYANTAGAVEHVAITSCNELGFYPTIKNSPLGKVVEIGKTKMSGIVDGASQLRDGTDLNRHYFMRGATAPSYYIDEIYTGNLGTYQTVYSGSVEYCGGIKFPDDIFDSLNEASVNATPFNNEQVNRFRDGVVINAYAVSAPGAESLYGPYDAKPEDRRGVRLSIDYTNAGIIDRCNDKKQDIPEPANLADFERYSMRSKC
ncbi:MAG: hypothetical protein EOO88_23540 [Pedobacter sp.]|nr:MAG: hypothetical protein EOO88_23540 [Pedobacter sp.]